ncbi:MAG TPA: hypothetical protein VHV28_13270 [Solirubrobacteraceae bacterium]|jgi:hypothetical protein|nr:hypothetical protein [Solirubrobacteraceae bacterium]
MAAARDDSLAILLLPGPLEGFEREDHARNLLAVPRVLALEASKRRAPSFLRNALPMRQARRLRLPGQVRMIVLYHPAQYPLARALVAHHDGAELWYLPPERTEVIGRNPEETQELLVADSLARDRSTQMLAETPGGDSYDDPLRVRLHELNVINAHAFFPEARFTRSRFR